MVVYDIEFVQIIQHSSLKTKMVSIYTQGTIDIFVQCIFITKCTQNAIEIKKKKKKLTFTLNNNNKRTQIKKKPVSSFLSQIFKKGGNLTPDQFSISVTQNYYSFIVYS